MSPEDDAWNRKADEPFDPSDLLNHGVLFEEARTVVLSLDEGKTKDIVLILGDHYTIWPASAFRAWANRLLKQL